MKGLLVAVPRRYTRRNFSRTLLGCTNLELTTFLSADKRALMLCPLTLRTVRWIASGVLCCAMARNKHDPLADSCSRARIAL